MFRAYLYWGLSLWFSPTPITSLKKTVTLQNWILCNPVTRSQQKDKVIAGYRFGPCSRATSGISQLLSCSRVIRRGWLWSSNCGVKNAWHSWSVLSHLFPVFWLVQTLMCCRQDPWEGTLEMTRAASSSPCSLLHWSNPPLSASFLRWHPKHLSANQIPPCSCRIFKTQHIYAPWDPCNHMDKRMFTGLKKPWQGIRLLTLQPQLIRGELQQLGSK